MKIDPKDPKLTAYALGELDDSNRAAIEEALEESEAVGRGIEEIRLAMGLVKEELTKEECPQLSEKQREAVTELLKHEPSKAIIPFPLTKGFFWISLSAAAAIVLLLGIFSTQRASKPAYRHMAQTNLRELEERREREPSTCR